MAIKRGTVPEDWITELIVPLHNDKVDGAVFKYYRGVSVSEKCMQ